VFGAKIFLKAADVTGSCALAADRTARQK